MKKISLKLPLKNNDLYCFAQLRSTFVQACNDVSLAVLSSHSKSRSVVHGLIYGLLREKYPHLGAQLSCNAIYAVTKIYKQVAISVRDLKKPIIFAPSFPLIYDSRTISFFPRRISIFTPSGRLSLPLDSDDLYKQIQKMGIKEVLLYQKAEDLILDIRFKNFGDSLDIDQDAYYQVAA